jgi:hypothetical protein
VVVEVVDGEVGESGGDEGHAVDAVFGEADRGDFHDGDVDAGGDHLGEEGVQGGGFGGGEAGVVVAAGDAVAEGADDAFGFAGGLGDGGEQGGDGGLAVGAGEADEAEFFGGVAVQVGGEAGEVAAGGGEVDGGEVGLFGGFGGARFIGEREGDGAGGDGGGHEAAAVGGAAGQGDEERAGS